VADIEKAFDTVEQQELWKALREVGVEERYVQLLQNLYSEQSAYVTAGEQSRKFHVTRGVKQGDPISGLLFLVVMEVCFRSLRKKWKRLDTRRTGQYLGFVIDDPDEVMSHLCFADDVMLFAQNASDAVKMLTHFREEAAKYGLRLHIGKTKILTTTSSAQSRNVIVGDDQVEVLSSDGTEKYLGRAVNLHDFHNVELKNRLRNAWAAFAKFKDVFRSKAYTLTLKSKLFDSVVTPVALYGSACWTLTKDMEHNLLTTQRRMLRQMLSCCRRSDEDWVDYVKRSTALAEQLFYSRGLTDWITASRRQKWRFASRTARASDNRWSKRILEWRPFFRCQAVRNVGRPFSRWEDVFVQVCGGDWCRTAKDEKLFELLKP